MHFIIMLNNFINPTSILKRHVHTAVGFIFFFCKLFFLTSPIPVTAGKILNGLNYLLQTKLITISLRSSKTSLQKTNFPWEYSTSGHMMRMPTPTAVCALCHSYRIDVLCVRAVTCLCAKEGAHRWHERISCKGRKEGRKKKRALRRRSSVLNGGRCE